MKTLSFITTATLCLSALPAQALETSMIPERIVKAANQYVNTGHITGLGIVFLEKGKNPAYLHLGKTSHSGFAVDANTRFEIGSVTKLFTALEAAHFVEQEKLSPQDTLKTLMPTAGLTDPVQKIELKALLTHTSGLPRLAFNMSPKNAENPYADYTNKQLIDFLLGTPLPTKNKYSYSNAGFGLVGHLLTKHSKATDLNALFDKDILTPLNMHATSFSDMESLKITAMPHKQGEQTASWDFSPATAGAGGLRSTTRDMAQFLQASMFPESLKTMPLLQKAIVRSQQTLYKKKPMKMAYGWHLLDIKGQPLYFHNGGTGGFRSFVAFDSTRQRGAVILGNDTQSVDALGFALLNEKFPLAPIKDERLSKSVLDRYVGKFKLAPGAIFEITQKNGYLKAKLSNQPVLTVYPSGTHRFKYKEVEAELEFKFNKKGELTGLTLHQNGDHFAPVIKAK